MKKILSIPLSLLLTTSLGLGCANADVKDTPQFGHSSSSNSQSSSTYSGGSSYSGGYASTPTYYSAPVQTAHKARPAKRRPAPKNYDGVYLIKDKTVLKNTLTNTDILKESVKNGVKHGFNAATSLASLPHAGYKIIKDPEIVLKDRGLRKQIVETTAFSAVGAVPGAVAGAGLGMVALPAALGLPAGAVIVPVAAVGDTLIGLVALGATGAVIGAVIGGAVAGGAAAVTTFLLGAGPLGGTASTILGVVCGAATDVLAGAGIAIGPMCGLSTEGVSIAVSAIASAMTGTVAAVLGAGIGGTVGAAAGAATGAVTGGATGLFVGAAASAAIGALVGIPAVLGGVAVGGGVGATLGATVLGSAAHGVVSGISATGLSIENAARRHDGYGPIQVNHAMADYQSPVQNVKEMIDLFGKGLVEEKGPSDLANGGKDSLEKITHTFDNTDLGKKINKVIERHHGDKK